MGSVPPRRRDSSVGGFVGGALAFAWYTRGGRLPRLRHADALIYALLIGFTFGRVGCSLVHDHPGPIVGPDAWLAVGPWPDGQWRLDLGLVELLGLLVLDAVVYGVLARRPMPAGRLTAIVAITYASGRFPLDFLRADDERYAGLTPAQLACVAFVVAGLALLWRTRDRMAPRIHPTSA